MYVFCDSSVNNKKCIAIGAYLFLEDINNFNVNEVETEIQNKISIIQFDSNSSTIAEYLTIKYVLEKLDLMYTNKYPNITLYTDCENFVNLITKRKNNPKLVNHRNYELYIHLINLIEKLNITVIWTKGHSNKENKIHNYQKIFSLVDDEARNTLRLIIKQ